MLTKLFPIDLEASYLTYKDEIDAAIKREGMLPCTEAVCQEILSLPMYPQLKEEHVCRISELIVNWFT